MSTLPQCHFHAARVGTFSRREASINDKDRVTGEKSDAIWRVQPPGLSGASGGNQPHLLPNLLCAPNDSEPVAHPPRASAKVICRSEYLDQTGLEHVGPAGSYPQPPIATGPVVVLDWDDTIYPTAWLSKNTKSLSTPLPAEAERSMRLLEDSVIAFLTQVLRTAKVAIVTLARRPWVEESCAMRMPALKDFIELHKIKVAYAREFAHLYDYKEPLRILDSEAEEEIGHRRVHQIERFIHMKYSAFASMVAKTAWTQFVCVGDSEFEMHAARILERTCFDGQSVKTLKLLGDPTIHGLLHEFAVISEGWDELIDHNAGFHCDLGGLLNKALAMGEISTSEYLAPSKDRMFFRSQLDSLPCTDSTKLHRGPLPSSIKCPTV